MLILGKYFGPRSSKKNYDVCLQLIELVCNSFAMLI